MTTNREVMDALDALRADVYALRDQQAGQENTATPPCAPTGAHVVAFLDKDSEATAQGVYAYIRAHPGATRAKIEKECKMPKHWMTNIKVLANGERVRPSLAFMRARAGAGMTIAPQEPKAATPVPVQADADKRAVAIKVAAHLDHARALGLEHGLLYDGAKSTKTLATLAGLVRERGGCA